jgi:hypothetical protein
MRRIAFAIVVTLPAVANAQSREIPGRDLLNFPLGLTAEAAPLATQSGAGLWNPATSFLPEGSHWRLGAAAMNTADDVGISAQVGFVAGAWHGTTLGLTVARAEVADLLRTDADPSSIGNEIPYTTMVVSGIVARQLVPHLIGGLAIRIRTGQLDDLNRTGASLDLGILADHLSPNDVRLGASTFLLSPIGSGREHASLLLGADARLLGSDSVHAVRAGYALTATPGLSAEHYVFAAARWSQFEVRGGPVRTDIYGAFNMRLRLGVAVRHGGYVLAVSREDSANGLAPAYHFSLTSVLK